MEQPANSLKMADGTIFENSDCGYSKDTLWCWIHDVSMTQCFSVFSDAEKTKDITVRYHTSEIEYKGFTELTIIKKGTDVLGKETVDLCLTWPEGGEHSIEERTITPNEDI